jgi:hypothetical protein
MNSVKPGFKPANFIQKSLYRFFDKSGGTETAVTSFER